MRSAILNNFGPKAMYTGALLQVLHERGVWGHVAVINKPTHRHINCC